MIEALPIRELPIGELIQALAQRTSTPGGGAAAALTAALGCAAGAMAARYTDGPKYAGVAAAAAHLANLLDAAASDCLRLATEDADSYAAVRAAKVTKNAANIAEAERQAAQVPAELLATCAIHARTLATFAPDCNRWLLSDVQVGVHLLAGAGRAAMRTLAVNNPDAEILAVARAHVTALADAESALD